VLVACHCYVLLASYWIYANGQCNSDDGYTNCNNGGSERMSEEINPEIEPLLEGQVVFKGPYGLWRKVKND